MSQKPGFGKLTALIALAASLRRVSVVAATKGRRRGAGWMLAEAIRMAAADPNSAATTKIVDAKRYPSSRHSRPTKIVSTPIGSILMLQYPGLLRSAGSA